MPPPEHPSYEVLIPEAARLAGLGGICCDLADVRNYCMSLHARSGRTIQHDLALRDAIFSAAIVRYARCFVTGTRYGPPSSTLDTAPPHLRVAHDRFIAIRGKHVAHSVNALEHSVVRVEIGEHYTLRKRPRACFKAMAEGSSLQVLM